MLISKIRKFCIFVIFWPVAPNSSQIFSLSWIRRFIHTTLYPLVASEKKSFSFAKIFIWPVFWQFDNSFRLKENFSLQMSIFYGRKTFWRGFDSAEGKSCSKRKYYTKENHVAKESLHAWFSAIFWWKLMKIVFIWI